MVHFIDFNEINVIFVILISLGANVLIAILGVVPSVFVTSFNLIFFGPLWGFVVSLLGESLGAVTAFSLYRKGFKKKSEKYFKKHEKIDKLLIGNQWEQSKLVFSLRLFPYMPSGFVTYAAAISNMTLKYFIVASTLGKIPAMIIEVAIVTGILAAAQSQNIIFLFVIISIIIVAFVLKKLVYNEK